MTKAQQQDKAEAIEYLRKRIKPGDRVYTTVTHVSRSGMSRSIKVCIVVGDEIVDVSGWVGRATVAPCTMATRDMLFARSGSSHERLSDWACLLRCRLRVGQVS